MNSTFPTNGPLSGHAKVDDIVASLAWRGFSDDPSAWSTSVAAPVLAEPLARWALSTIWRETLRIVLVSLPILVWVNVALLMFTLADRPSLALGIGVAAGVGASPVAALVGFALAWRRWGHLANDHAGAPATSGYVVVVARGSEPAAPIDATSTRNLVAVGRLAAAEGGAADDACRRRKAAVAGGRSRVGRRRAGVVIVVTSELAETHRCRSRSPRLSPSGPRRRPGSSSRACDESRYRLLVVSNHATRLFEAVRDDVVEVVTHGFPLSADIVRRDRRAIAGRFARSPGREDREQWRNFYRTVDQALTDAGGDDPLPIVLAGVNSSTSLFLESDRHGGGCRPP